MSNSTEIENKLRELKPYLESEYGVDQIGYFGSFAKGNQSEDSDLDVLVSFKRKVGWKFFDLKFFLEKAFGIEVDLVTERALRKQWKRGILDEVKYV